MQHKAAHIIPISRENSMILTFHVPPLARGQGLRDIDGFQAKKSEKF